MARNLSGVLKPTSLIFHVIFANHFNAVVLPSSCLHGADHHTEADQRCVGVLQPELGRDEAGVWHEHEQLLEGSGGPRRPLPQWHL